MPTTLPILIAGGGPVGCITALALARQGIPVHLFEAATCVNDSPRAATTHAATLEMLAELGLVEEVIRHGLTEPKFRIWDRASRKVIVEFDFGVLGNDTRFPYVVQCEQHKLANMAIERLRRMPNAQVLLGCAVSGISQDEKQVMVIAGERHFAADYVIGCDGGRSTVRKQTDIEFEGYTWPERFLVITTHFDFQAALGCCLRTYMADPDEWTNLFKVAGDDLKGRWRAVFNTRPDETDEEALSDDSVRARLARCYAPNANWLHLNLYSVHQRVARNFRKGRVFLCGDAAHVNNPIGGLGLNCGIHEAWDLANLLGGDESKLDAYERRRRPLNIKYVQEQTVANKKQLEERNPAQREKRFDELRRTAEDPARHKSFLMRASLLESARDAIRA